MDRYDVIVVGCGGVGSAVCDHVARRGLRVLGIDRFDIPNTMGSSHGQSRAIRLCYYEHPDYVPLLRRSFELWHELEEATGANLLSLTGGLYMGLPDGEFVGDARRVAESHGIDHEVLEHAALRDRYPQFHVPEDFVGFYESTAGVVAAEEAVEAQVRRAAAAGAGIHGNERVVAYEATDGGGVTVTTDRGVYGADQLVLTVGAWAGKFIRDLPARVWATRQVFGWVMPRDPSALRRAPMWAIEDRDGLIYYGFPVTDRHAGFKLALHHPGEEIDPDTYDRHARVGEEEDFMPAIRSWIPDAEGPLLSVRRCMYTMSPDWHFIVDRLPSAPSVWVATGLSGHGFKFVPVLGEVLADLVETGTTPHPIEFLRLSRLAGEGAS